MDGFGGVLEGCGGGEGLEDVLYVGAGNSARLAGGSGVDGEGEYGLQGAELDGARDFGGHGMAAFGTLGGCGGDGFEDAAQGWGAGLAHVVLDEAGGAGGVEEDVEGEVGGGLRGGYGVKGQTGLGSEGLAGPGQAGRTRGHDFEEGFGKGESLGGEGFEDGGQGLFLIFRGDDLREGLAVAAERIAVVEAANFLDGGFGLVTMEEIERDEGVFELGKRGAGFDGVLAEAFQGGGTDFENAAEFVSWVTAVIPEVRVGVSAGERAGVFVSDVDESALFRAWCSFELGGNWR